jgi:uncharacterized protein YjdB
VQRARAIVGLAAIVTGVGIACSHDTTGPNVHHVTDVVMTPDTLTLIVGDTATVNAQPVTAGGAPVNGQPLFWSTADQTIATVNQAGRVTAVGLGQTNIDASTAGVSPSHPTRVFVIPTPVAFVVVAPPAVTLRVGGAFQFSDTTKDVKHRVLNGRTVVWSSSDTTVAPVDQSGLVLAKKQGLATITATSGAVNGSATVTVSTVPVKTIILAPTNPSVIIGDSTQLSATTKDSAGNILTGRLVTWASSNTAVATIDAAGIATGIKVGADTITATSGGATATTILTVQAVPINSVVISPQSSNLLVGQQQTITAEVTDNAGNPIAGSTVMFSSGSPGVATVTATGPLSAMVTAVSSGQAVITGRSGTKSGTATENVAQVPIASITVTPPIDTVTLGGTVQLTATIKDSAGNTLTGRSVTWGSSNAAVATVSTTGLVTTVGVGAAAISAKSSGQTGFAAVTVNQVPVGSVVISPLSDTVTVGGQRQLGVTVTDSLGRTITNPAVTWSSSNNGIAFVSSTGLIQGVNPGNVQIIAKSGNKSDTNATLVVAAQTATVTVTPPTQTVIVGQTAIVAARQQDVSGTTLPGRTVTWSTGTPGTVSVSAGGIDPNSSDAYYQLDTATVTGAAVGGPVTITATAGNNVSGSAQVTVSAVPVAYIVVTPNPFSVNIGFTQQMTATAYDANNTVLSGRQFTWSTKSGGAIGSVDQNGVVTGVATGSSPDSVFAQTGGKTGAAGFTVTRAPVATVHVAPLDTTVNASPTQKVQMRDTVFDALGHVLTGRIVTWSTTAPASLATIEANTGIVTPAGNGHTGNVSVTATSEGKTASTTVHIVDPVTQVIVVPASSNITSAPGQTVQLSDTLKDAYNAVLSGSVTWSSSNTSVATVDPTTGLVSPTGVNDSGTVTITATASDGVNGSATVHIALDPVSNISVGPPGNTITTAQTQALTATVTDGSGNPLTRTVTWASNNTGLATVSSTGLVSPVGTVNDTGTVTITASVGAVNGSAAVHIVNVAVTGVSVTPGSATIYATAPNNTRALTATTAPVAGIAVTWSNNGSTVANVDGNGNVTASGTALGGPSAAATITATSTNSTANGTAAITVIGHIGSVTPNPGLLILSVATANTTTATAQLIDTFGTDVSSVRPVTWSSSDPTTITINGSATPVVVPSGATSVSLQAISTNSTSVTITATADDGTPGSVVITVGP